jgi:hypothetical protein
MSNYTHEDLVKRLDRIEHKLDIYLEQLSKHETDLKWVQGYIKVSVSALIGLAGGLATALFQLFTRS